jgi:hypothetical protein
VAVKHLTTPNRLPEPTGRDVAQADPSKLVPDVIAVHCHAAPRASAAVVVAVTDPHEERFLSPYGPVARQA